MLFCLQQLPIEIFHTIFGYLWAHEILYAFHNINGYLDNILLSYQNYLVNLTSIRRSHFDLVCQLRADQMNSLVLSDNIDTPKQSQLFQSIFSMEQFTCLRSLKCIEVEDDENLIFSNLYKIPHLKSLEIDLKFRVPLIVTPRSLERFIINTSPNTQFNIDLGISLVRFEHLRELSLPICPCNYLKRIFHEAIRLTSLKISFVFLNPNDLIYFTNIHQQSIVPPLTSLSLSITENCGKIERSHLEQFLVPLQYLKDLEVIIPSPGKLQLVDAYQWELFIINHLPRLKTFNFKFFILLLDLHILNQFRRPFWIDREWYVACDFHQSFLFSVPYFAPTSVEHSRESIPFDHTTLPIEQYRILDNRITELIFSSERNKSHHHYNNIDKLKIYGHHIQKNALDLSKVQSFIVNSPEWSLERIMKLIKQAMPSVNYLSLICAYPRHCPCTNLNQIRTLVFPRYGELFDNDSIDWSGFFPRVERLTACITSKKQIPFFIDQFKNLISGHFFAVPNDCDKKKRIKVTHSWLTKHIQRLNGKKMNNFTCDIYNSYFFTLSLWINDANNHKFEKNVITRYEKWPWYQCFT
ncbi:hypothetical protein I4U23_020199 [Adineta vaga]|nr:hypothetical protein I4U23_020199 [Adineta vaga]